MLGRRGGLINLYVFIADALILGVSYLGAWLLYRLFMHTFGVSTGGTVLLMFLALFFVSAFFNNNSGFLKRNRTEELAAVIKMSVIYGLSLGALIFVFRSFESISRLTTVISLVLFVVLDYLGRLLLKMMFKKGRKGFGNYMILVTDEANAEKHVQVLSTSDEIDAILAGVVLVDTDKTGMEIHGVPVVTGRENLFDFAKRQIVDEAVIVLPPAEKDFEGQCINELGSMGIVVHVALPTYADKGAYIKTPGEVADIPVMTFSQSVQDTEKLVIKRIGDIFVGLVGMVFLGILTLFLAPIIKIESKGPVFFKQKRVGRNGRYFYMYKFRSMYADAEERKKELMDKNEMQGQMFKMTDDPRITKVGKFIRKTSLDEFPQFINILKGDMSVIGTRPPTVDEFKQYEEHHKRRLSMKPGLTGMWQISGRSDITDFEEVVRMDCYYIDHWSLWLDIKIFFKTFVAVFRRKGSR